MRWAGILVACAACWAEPPAPVVPRAPPPPPPRPVQTYSQPHRIAAARAPATAFEEAMMRIGDFTEEMCRCTDTACTQTVMNEITTWGSAWQQQHPDWKGSEEENRQIAEVVQPLMECMQHVGQGSATP